MFEQTFKNIDDIFHKDAGCSSELDYTEQSSSMRTIAGVNGLRQKTLTAILTTTMP
jgi:type I restriction enzyme M protein